MNRDQISFIANVRRLRADGVTLEQIADLVGCSASSVSRWASGDSVPARKFVAFHGGSIEGLVRLRGLK